jgi:phosphoenolpyruvate carboxykinase (ATP)
MHGVHHRQSALSAGTGITFQIRRLALVPATLSHTLADQGIATNATIHANLGSAELTRHALDNGEGRKAKHGPLVVETGKHTGRSAKDKFIVRDGETEDTVWWDNNASMTPAQFAALKEDFLAAVGSTSPICSADRSPSIG